MADDDTVSADDAATSAPPSSPPPAPPGPLELLRSRSYVGLLVLGAVVGVVVCRGRRTSS